jgi:hypothetical protein
MGYSSTILDLGTSVVSFTPRPLYPRVNRPRCPFDRRLGEPQSQSGRYGEDNYFASAGNRSPALQSVARRGVNWAIQTPIMTCSKKLVFFSPQMGTSSKRAHDESKTACGYESTGLPTQFRGTGFVGITTISSSWQPSSPFTHQGWRRKQHVPQKRL